MQGKWKWPALAVVGLVACVVLTTAAVAVAATIIGDDGDNRLIGTRTADVIDAKGGNDHVRGRKGDDRVTSGLGDDHVRGGLGNDAITGDDGNDRLHGGWGNDSAD